MMMSDRKRFKLAMMKSVSNAIGRRSFACLMLFACASAIPIALNAQSSKVEKKIVAAVDFYRAENLRLWEDAVNINSGSMNFEGVRKVGELYKPKFEALGFTTRWVDGSAFGRAGHLIAEHFGNQAGKKILLIGHLD